MSLIDETLIYAYDQKPTDKPVLSLHIKLEMVIPPKEKIEIDDYESADLLLDEIVASDAPEHVKKEAQSLRR